MWCFPTSGDSKNLIHYSDIFLILATDGYLTYHAKRYTGTVWLIQEEEG